MRPQDPPARRRRRLGSAFLPLLVGAIAIVAAGQLTPAPDGAVLAAVASPSSVVPTSVRSGSSLRPWSGELSPILERRGASAISGRPAVTVPRPSVKTVPKGTVSGQATAGTQAGAGSKAVFLGDSYTTGWNGAGLGARGWPRRVGLAKGWRTVNLAVAGTGFINPGWTNQPVRSRVSAAIARHPDIVFVAAGHNDSHWSAAATAKAADKVIDRLHKALPHAVLVIVAPIWPNGNPPARCLALRDHLRRKAAAVHAIFIDPLAERWFAGKYRRLIGSDGIHPTDAGHLRMAKRVLANLAKAG
jgi:lysophospholipase L1-like esterase